jgi:hypothetical protein
MYNPLTEQISIAGHLIHSRSYAASFLLPSGKIFITHGYDSSYVVVVESEIFDPATGISAPAGTINIDNSANGTFALLEDGRILSIGGYSPSPPYDCLRSCEIYDPALGIWSITGSLNYPAVYGNALTCPDGKVILTGGTSLNGGYSFTLTCEIYDPALGTWSIGPDSPEVNIWMHKLSDGRYVGLSDYANPSFQIFDPISKMWSTLNGLGKVTPRILLNSGESISWTFNDKPEGLNIGTPILINGQQVVGPRGTAIADATNAPSLITQVNAILAQMRLDGKIAT